MTTVDYNSASKRHFKDAQLLKRENRVLNAGQLVGFSAECGIKAMLVKLGCRTTINGDLEDGSLRKHIHQFKWSQLKSNIEIILHGRSAPEYFVGLPLSEFSDWHTDHRYCPDEDRNIPTLYDKWEHAAKSILDTLEKTVLDGRKP